MKVIIIELVVMALQMLNRARHLGRIIGMTDEEFDTLYSQKETEFHNKPANLLPDV